MATAQLGDRNTARGSRTEPAHVLVVSGEDITRALAAIALSDAGYEVLEDTSASAALERLADTAVEAIALDTTLAETDRLDFERAYPRLSALRTPVLLFNAQESPDVVASSGAANPSYTVRTGQLGQVLGRLLQRRAA